jgi:hypothetical protein
MWPRNTLTDRLGLDCPIIVAPMARATTPELLAAAVSNAGGLGSLGLAAPPSDAAEEQVAAFPWYVETQPQHQFLLPRGSWRRKQRRRQCVRVCSLITLRKTSAMCADARRAVQPICTRATRPCAASPSKGSQLPFWSAATRATAPSEIERRLRDKQRNDSCRGVVARRTGRRCSDCSRTRGWRGHRS